ncbi:MAG: GreA/GreB family elongation factor [Rhodospirillaceae bacterium]|nr:GreA/GreB family elongation factor [Rhodospirillaceae bacterium]
MSRAFVKEDDGAEVSDELPERPQSPYPNHVTQRGLELLEAQLKRLQEQRQKLQEDPEGLMNRESLKLVERDIRYVQERIERAVVIDPATQPHDQVAFGARVETEDEEGERRVFTLVGEDEADPAAGLISWVSPLGRALTGARVGDVVTWKRPVGDLQLEILSIAYPRVTH